MQDIIIKCVDCQQDFPWTTDEQEYYLQKNLKPPQRCPVCRAAYKLAQKDKFRGKLTFSKQV